MFTSNHMMAHGASIRGQEDANRIRNTSTFRRLDDYYYRQLIISE